ncbi:MAG TPA: peptidoglycan DD-metalloendopeptidase family protein [Candidatus Paceibacterota bacterium]|nr:peptidoglycan DD-metalloendopeptidase family protein [Candidatus Paceibacterota bacterium]
MATPAMAQVSDEERYRQLQQRYEELQREADRVRQSLTATQAEKQTLQREVNSIKGQISYMQSKINATSAKIDLTNTEIGRIEEDIRLTQLEMDEKRGAISRLIAIRDQQDRESLIANLIRFTNLSDLFQQVQDAVSVHTRLSALLTELSDVRFQLETDKSDLEGKRTDLEELNDEQFHQKAGLDEARYAQEKLLTQTRGQESAYQKQLADIEKQSAAFFKELRELELKAASGGFYIVDITATGVPPPGTKIFSAPEAAGYRVTQGYGMTAYAKRGAYGGAGHNGYDIASGLGTPIRSIGAGTVVANGTSSGWGNWVAIQHPPYNMVSVYAHMSSFTVKAGTQVTTSTVIGYEGNTGFVTGPHLHLSLYTKFVTFLGSNGQLAFNYMDGSVNPASYINF